MNRYEEKQMLHPIINILYLVMVGFMIWAVFNQPGPILLLIPVVLVLLLIPIVFGRLVIIVDEQTVYVAFGLFGWPAQRISLNTIQKSSVVDYKPIRNFGGWGIRRGRLNGESTSAYTTRGNRGVLLELSEEYRICGVKTNRFLVSSRHPERLHAAIGK
jgi:hypothetical protein